MHIAAVLLDLYKYHADAFRACEHTDFIASAIEATSLVAEKLGMHGLCENFAQHGTSGAKARTVNAGQGLPDKWIIEALLANYSDKKQKQERERAWGIANVLLIANDSSLKLKQELGLCQGRKVKQDDVDAVVGLLTGIVPDMQLHTERFDYLAEAEQILLESVLQEQRRLQQLEVKMPPVDDLMLLAEYATIGCNDNEIRKAELCNDLSPSGFGLLMQGESKERKAEVQALITNFASAEVLTKESLLALVNDLLAYKAGRVQEAYAEVKVHLLEKYDGQTFADRPIAYLEDAARMLEARLCNGYDFKQIVNTQLFMTRNRELQANGDTHRLLRKTIAKQLTIDELKSIIGKRGIYTGFIPLGIENQPGWTKDKISRMHRQGELPKTFFVDELDLSPETIKKVANDLADLFYEIAVANEAKSKGA